MRLRLSCSGPVELSTRDGTVVAALESVTLSVDLRALRAISDGPGGTIGVKAVDVSSQNDNDNNPYGPIEDATTQGQASMLPDPVNETWEVYVKALDRPKAVLTPKVRKWIADAHRAVGVDATRQAIRGLGASDYHRENGYVGIEYAIAPKRGETIEGRVEKMAAKATAQPPNSLLSMAQLIERFPSEFHARLRSEVLGPIEAMPQSSDGGRDLGPDGRDRYLKGQAQLQAMRGYGFEIVFEGERIAGARKL